MTDHVRQHPAYRHPRRFWTVLSVLLVVLVTAAAQPALAGGTAGSELSSTSTGPTPTPTPSTVQVVQQLEPSGDFDLTVDRGETVQVPPPPDGWEGEIPAPATTSRGGLGKLSTGGTAAAPECVTTFDEDEPFQYLLNNALDTFVYSPFWNQQCGDNWVRVRATQTNHYHIGYTDPEVDVCLNGDNPNGTPIGQMSRGDDCDPIDPVTEPRSHLSTMVPTDVIHIERLVGQAYDIGEFTLSRIEVKQDPVRLCFWLPGPWEAAAPPPEGLIVGSYCWSELGVGTWDLSGYTDGSVEVLVQVADPSDFNFGLDNLHFDW